MQNGGKKSELNKAPTVGYGGQDEKEEITEEQIF
jgi:hypothetical protein